MQSLLPKPACCPAPLLPACHPLTIPFSLASNSVITYHHRPGTLAAVHFPVYSSCHRSLERHLPGPSKQSACVASFLVLTLSRPPLGFFTSSSGPGAQLGARPVVGAAWAEHHITGSLLHGRSGRRPLPYVTASHLTGHTHDQYQEEGTGVLIVK